jgi:hypothetical protein
MLIKQIERARSIIRKQPWRDLTTLQLSRL